MKIRWHVLISASLFIWLLTCPAAGQTTSTDPSLKGRVVEVNFSDSRPGSKIALIEGRANGFWTSNVPRLQNWQQIQGTDLVQAISFAARSEGEKAAVTISAFKGKRFGEISEIIAQFSLSLGESVTVNEMKRYGFEPLSLRLVSTDPSMASLPNVDNPSRTLWVSVRPFEAALPSFGLTFRNDSSKSVLAIAFHSEANGRTILSGMPQGQYGRPLMEPGAEYKTTMKSNGHDDIRVVVDAVIYEDKTIEGDQTRGGTFLAYLRGRNAALTKLMPILRSASSMDGKVELPALIDRIDREAIFPRTGTNTVSGSVSTQERVAFESVVKDMIVALRKLESMNSLPPSEVQRVFGEFVQFNQEWLDRISK